MAIHRQYLIVGATPQKRSSMAVQAVTLAHNFGWRGKEFLVSFGASPVGKLLDSTHSQEALAIAATGSLLERMTTAQAVSLDYQDAIIATDWYGCWPYYQSIQNDVAIACAECFKIANIFDLVISCVPLESLQQQEYGWLKENIAVDIVDMADSPRAFARVLLGW